MNSLMRKREDKGSCVSLVAGWLDMPILRLLKAPRDHGVTAEDLALITLDNGKSGAFVIALLVKNRGGEPVLTASHYLLKAKLSLNGLAYHYHTLVLWSLV